MDLSRKKLLYRCHHRGTRELDKIIGDFADAYLAQMDTAQVSELERVLELPEPELQDYLTGRSQTSPAPDSALLSRMRGSVGS